MNHNKSYRPVYHASVPSGWSNDPNGTIYYNGKAHLFYQHYPHKPEWGTMHWGHFTTEDFVRWENLPVALVPDQDYEVICGCCSGSAIEKDGKLYLMYTAAQPELQRQCLAVSKDGGVTFEKDPDNPVLTAQMLSREVSELDFRDPRLFKKDGFYYFIAGVRIVDPEKTPVRSASSVTRPAVPVSPSLGRPASGTIDDVSGTSEEKDGYGNLILVRSKDFRKWEYVGYLLHRQQEWSEDYYTLNGVYECPDYQVIDGTEVLFSSPQNLPQMGYLYQNIHSGLYMLGQLDFEDGHFRVDKIGEIDSGFDFYAAQTLRTPDGRTIMIAWKEMWDRNYPTQSEGWAGTYTLPRELSVKDGALYQKPVRELEAYRKDPVFKDALTVDAKAVDGQSADGKAINEQSADAKAVNGQPSAVSAFVPVPEMAGNVMELRFTLEPGTADRAGVKLYCGDEHETRVYFDAEKGAVVFDRSRSGLKLRGREENVETRVCEVGHPAALELRMFLDVSSLEVFIDGGRHVMTGNVYPDPADTGVAFFAEGGAATFRGIERYNLM